MTHPICVECGFSLTSPSNLNNNNNDDTSSNSSNASSKNTTNSNKNLKVSSSTSNKTTKTPSNPQDLLYDPSEKVLKQCSRCGNTCDPFLETDHTVTGLNVALLRKSAWRHVIHNQIDRRALITAFCLSILLETLVALCWKKSSLAYHHHNISSNFYNSTHLSYFHQQQQLMDSNAAAAAVSAGGATLTATSTISSFLIEKLFMQEQSPLFFLQPFILTFMASLTSSLTIQETFFGYHRFFGSSSSSGSSIFSPPKRNFITPLTLQLSNASNPLYYPYPHVINDGDYFASVMSSADFANNNHSTLYMIKMMATPSRIETFRLMILLGFCSLAETVLLAVAIVSCLTLSRHHHHHKNVVSATSSGSGTGSSSSPSAAATTKTISVVTTSQLSMGVVMKGVLLASCARLALLPFLVWSIPLELLSLIEFSQFLWYYLASGALTLEDARIRRWAVVGLMLVLRTMFRLVTQWAPILGWF